MNTIMRNITMFIGIVTMTVIVDYTDLIKNSAKIIETTSITNSNDELTSVITPSSGINVKPSQLAVDSISLYDLMERAQVYVYEDGYVVLKVLDRDSTHFIDFHYVDKGYKDEEGFNYSIRYNR